jgi:hypothetical protein
MQTIGSVPNPDRSVASVSHLEWRGRQSDVDETIARGDQGGPKLESFMRALAECLQAATAVLPRQHE